LGGYNAAFQERIDVDNARSWGIHGHINNRARYAFRVELIGLDRPRNGEGIRGKPYSFGIVRIAFNVRAAVSGVRVFSRIDVSIHTPPWGRDRSLKEPYRIRPSKGIFANIGKMFAKMPLKYTKMSKFF
jgi:hypothetical protein